MTIVSKNSLQLMLEDADPTKRAKILGRALVVLFRNQTTDEQSANTTNRDNGTGFGGCDAYSGSLTAKYFLKHSTLLPWMVEKWMKPSKSGYARLCKYHRQLDAAAAMKLAAKQPV